MTPVQMLVLTTFRQHIREAGSKDEAYRILGRLLEAVNFAVDDAEEFERAAQILIDSLHERGVAS